MAQNTVLSETEQIKYGREMYFLSGVCSVNEFFSFLFDRKFPKCRLNSVPEVIIPRGVSHDCNLASTFINYKDPPFLCILISDFCCGLQKYS